MPLFKQRQAPDAEGFYESVPADEIQPDQMTAVEINGTRLILTRWQGQVYAFSSLCPHAAGDLRQGSLHKGRVDCPDHGYRFDIRTGRALWPEDEMCRLKCYQVKVVGGIVWVKLR